MTNDRVWQLPERLEIATINQLLPVARQKIAQRCLAFDFSMVRHVDSSALAFILASRREAMKQHGTLTCRHLPDNLISLSRLYGVEPFIIDTTT